MIHHFLMRCAHTAFVLVIGRVRGAAAWHEHRRLDFVPFDAKAMQQFGAVMRDARGLN